MPDATPYDALVVVSFGGPEGTQDVMPFLENVTRGRNIPRQRLEQVAEQYHRFGGVSPINAINRNLIDKLEASFAADGIALPVYWGNRNWQPMLAVTVRRMRDDGVRRAIAFVTSAFSSYSSCRQYLEDIEQARAAVGPDAPRIDKIRPYWNHPRFIAAAVAQVRAACDSFAEPPHLVFTAHSIPLSMASGCDYEAQLRDAAALVAARVQPGRGWDLAYQSRSGPPSQPWLEPDINDHLIALAGRGVRDVVVVPIGFVADHMEVLFDLDTQAAATARDRGIRMVRAATAGTSPEFIAMIRNLVDEAMQGLEPASVGKFGPRRVPCPAECCRYTPAHGRPAERPAST